MEVVIHEVVVGWGWGGSEAAAGRHVDERQFRVGRLHVFRRWFPLDGHGTGNGPGIVFGTHGCRDEVGLAKHR